MLVQPTLDNEGNPVALAAEVMDSFQDDAHNTLEEAPEQEFNWHCKIDASE
jgi:hypothetical protein